MKKILFIIFILLTPIYANALEYPNLNSRVVEIYDITDNKVLYEINSTKVSSIASLTKIATTITAIENISNLDEKVTITRDILNTVSWDASKAGLKVNDVVTYRDLLYASILPSGADATNSIAILNSGSISDYVKKMNELVKKIGLNNTHFVNVTGLDEENHYSTADDIRKLLQYSLKNPLFKEIYTTREYKLTNGLKVISSISLYNKNNIDTSKILGSKTGFTGNAGYCFSSLSNINNHEFITIVLNAKQKGDNLNDTVKILNFISDNYSEEILVKKGTVIKKLPVTLSKIDSYKIKSTSNIVKFLPKDYNKEELTIEYKGLEKLNYKNNKGQKIGTIKYYYDEELFQTENVVLNRNIDFSIKKFIIKYYYIIIIFALIIVIAITKLFLNKKNNKNKKKFMGK
ncbi:MAG: D-alanyl-D-alanine carboxypeptidase [Bacilli bacterium]|nr:D-alanyl-D-alanine carboxypeptidase [Bacilli bacterium]